MEIKIISGFILLLTLVQLVILLLQRKSKISRIKTYKSSIIGVCLYNINLLFIFLNHDNFLSLISRQALPIVTLLVFRNFYVDYYRCIGKKNKHSMSYLFVHLLPIIIAFTLGIDLLRSLINSELINPSIDVFNHGIIILIVGYQLFVLFSLMFTNFKLYRSSLARYGHVFLAHVFMDAVYILMTLIVFVLNKIQANLMISGILYSLYVFFLILNCIKKEWMPHANTKQMILQEPMKNLIDKTEENEDKRAIDSLTGVFTRSYFFSYLKKLDVNDDALAIVLMDVSGLKLINESFGYSVGDDILLEMSVALSDTFVKGSIARMSGRIFSVLVSGENENIILEKIKNIHAVADQRDFLKIQLNFGYYIRGSKDLEPMTVYKRAEEELYYNKFKNNQENQKELAVMLYENFKSFLPGLTNHLKRCSEMARAFGKYLKLEENKLSDLEHAALLHDIALISMPVMVELKMNFKDKHHERSYRNHVQRGYQVAIETGMNTYVSMAILQHHENYNGDGFPNQLKGDEIQELAQILSIVDFVDVYLSQSKSMINLENALKNKIELAFSKKMVYNMIAFLKTYHFEGENYEFN